MNSLRLIVIFKDNIKNNYLRYITLALVTYILLCVITTIMGNYILRKNAESNKKEVSIARYIRYKNPSIIGDYLGYGENPTNNDELVINKYYISYVPFVLFANYKMNLVSICDENNGVLIKDRPIYLWYIFDVYLLSLSVKSNIYNDYLMLLMKLKPRIGSNKADVDKIYGDSTIVELSNKWKDNVYEVDKDADIYVTYKNGIVENSQIIVKNCPDNQKLIKFEEISLRNLRHHNVVLQRVYQRYKNNIYK